MNFLNKPGMQDSVSSVVIKNNNNLLDVDVEQNELINDKSNFHYIVLSFLTLFFIFIIYVFSSNINTSLYKKSIFISDTLEELSGYDNLTIKSIENGRNKLTTILSCETEGLLFENVYDMKDKYPNVKIKTNNKIHEIWIEDVSSIKYSSPNFKKIVDIIENDNSLNIESEIINNNLIIIGTIKDIKYLFLLLEKNNLLNMEFNLNLIKHEYNNNYYKLIM